jgi:hypothetical protein
LEQKWRYIDNGETANKYNKKIPGDKAWTGRGFFMFCKPVRIEEPVVYLQDGTFICVEALIE